ncbi:hypothetical protein F5144DRAFT_390034 [Chaetomium tenue]|uniref:Uncharacterized protein n=1 Tax=Chaetomium tenue TaxID=1854479 RepID=A0ACB7NV49_9PEZI|nr:hypothetical protein F5144DRAFT_390034 [Chaetomium globosum]
MKTEGPVSKTALSMTGDFIQSGGRLPLPAHNKTPSKTTGRETRASNCEFSILANLKLHPGISSGSEQLNKANYQWGPNRCRSPTENRILLLEPPRTVEASPEGYIRPAADPPPKDPEPAALFPRESPCAGILVALANRHAADSPSEGPPRESSRLSDMRHGVHLPIGACFRVLPCFHGFVVPPLSISLASPPGEKLGKAHHAPASPIYTLPLI